ncbi:hypothetical protein SAMN05421493_10133 [Pseudobutyrivibrio sp. 49]|uniref:choice-of-anchor L domain-containing protein n=1 Tax=Pseudobutyrivibrio sp. 49 TaxID=1855344 RepID=UPI00088E0BB4|nr:choice-of-anchor L domain-containing protein [Pseudobutyrivibrio sp. 49]SDH25631.1 hypothetical protein SAMN05421493_10133 [Pseudobutyrivibrio sp. 49]
MKWENISTKQLITCTGIAFVRSTKKMIERNRVAYRTTAIVMVFAMVFTMGFGTPLAIAANGGADSVITNIESLGNDVAVQHLPVGASESDIIFPDTLNATLETYKEVLVEVIPEVEEKEEVPEEDEEETEEVTEEESTDNIQEVTEAEEISETDTESQESVAPVAESADDVVTEEPVVETPEAIEAPTVAEAPVVNETPVVTEAPAEAAPVESAPVIESAPVSEPVSEPEPADPVAFIIDTLFPAITVKAAEAGVFAEVVAATAEAVTGESVPEEEPVEVQPTYVVETITTSAEITLADITWSLDPSLSTAPAFDSNIQGANYVYRANISSGYAINSSIPTITVIIGELVEEKGFEQSTVVDGVVITVKADKGVFPEGASLFARRATAEETEVAEEAVENERESDNVAASYTFDIKVLDAAGNEIQPDTTKGTVKVSFTLEEAKNEALEADVYHITDANPQAPVAEKLETESNIATVEAETTGFSFYTVEFTYNGLQYVLEGDTSVYLKDILATLGIYGEITEAYSSAPELFNVVYLRNDWIVNSVNPFSSLEKLTTVVDGTTYEIEVTDAQNGVDSPIQPDSDKTGKSASDLVKSVLSDGVTAENAAKTGAVYGFTNGSDQVGIESGIILDTSYMASTNHDYDLEKLVTQLGYSYGGHTSTLEFTMIASGNLLNFNYVFASSEFDQSSCFNDAFGLFVSVNDGPYENIAKIKRSDNSLHDVTIVNLRAGLGGHEMWDGEGTDLSEAHSLFINKPVGVATDVSIKGVSLVFNAQKEVNTGDKVKVKFAICDCSDSSYDSFVFIEGGSLSFDAPNSNVDYFEEVLKGFTPGVTYEITCDDEVYTFIASDYGTIKIFGKDKNDKEYDFYGKTLSIVQKGDGETGDSEAQELSISERPTFTDPFDGFDLNQDADRPSEGNSNPIYTTKDSITITLDKDDKEKMGQVYRIYDNEKKEIEGQDWKQPEPDGTITFDNLQEYTEYILRYRRPATKKVPASKISDGISITTGETVEVTVSNTIDKDYDGKPVDFDITTNPTDATISYSTDIDGEFSSTMPVIKDAGEYTIYYKATKTDCTTTYGNFTVTIDKGVHEDVELTTNTNVPVKTTEEANIDLTKYVEDGAKLIDYQIEGDLYDYIDNVDFIDGKIVYNISENENGTTGVLKAKVRSTNYEDYTIIIPLISKRPAPVYVPTYISTGTTTSAPSSAPAVMQREETTSKVVVEKKDEKVEEKKEDEEKKPEYVPDIKAAQEIIPEIVEETTKVTAETEEITTDADDTLGKGKIIDKGDIWGDMTEDTKLKLLDKLEEKGGEVVKTANLIDPVASAKAELKAEENERDIVDDKVPVKETPIALVMGEGAVVVTLELTDNSKANAGLADAKAVAKSILTEEQYAAVAAGSILEIKVELTPLEEETIPELDRQVIDDGVTEYAEQIPNLSMADYIDISMFMRIDDSDWNQLTEVDPIDIVIDIPENHKGLSDTYFIMRAHEGVSTLLEDKDSDPDTITISTGQFSTYALMYDEPQVAVKADIVSTASTCNVCHKCPTLFGICYFVWLAIVAAAGISLELYKSTRKQQEEE